MERSGLRDWRRRALDVEQSGVNLGVPHEVLESRQRDARPYHVRSECVSKPVWIGGGDLTA